MFYSQESIEHSMVSGSHSVEPYNQPFFAVSACLPYFSKFVNAIDWKSVNKKRVFFKNVYVI